MRRRSTPGSVTATTLPIQRGQLGSALGQQTISTLAARSGLSEQELLAQLSAVLPQLINNLTPAGCRHQPNWPRRGIETSFPSPACAPRGGRWTREAPDE